MVLGLLVGPMSMMHGMAIRDMGNALKILPKIVHGI